MVQKLRHEMNLKPDRIMTEKVFTRIEGLVGEKETLRMLRIGV